MQQYKYKTVLLIDDNHIDNMISSKLLASQQYAEEILVMKSPKEAIDFIREAFRSGKNIPEVLFLDIRMPGMNGFDFLEEFGKIEGVAEHDVKTYVLSSSLDPKDYNMIQKNKLISKFIGKPLTPEILSEI